MGSIIYDFLTESFLFDQTRYDDCFKSISDRDIVHELQKYREFCVKRLDEITSEAVGVPTAMRVFAGLKEVGFQTLKQSALYIHQYVLPDPLFPFSEKRPNISGPTSSLLGYKNSDLDRGALVAALKRMKSLTPMVAANFVKFLPVSMLFEPQEETPVYYSPNQFSDILPPDTLRFLQERAIVRSLRKSDDGDGWIVEESLNRGRGIVIDFKGDQDKHSHIYHYWDQEVLKMDEDNRTFQFRLHMPPEPPSPEIFNAWVTQSVNRAAGDLFARTQTEFKMSTGMRMSFLTDSPLVNELLSRFFQTSSGSSIEIANVLLNVDVPFLENISVEDLMRVRTEDGEAFENFRNELTKQLWDVQSEVDPARRNEKAQKAFHDLGRAQTHHLEMKAREFQKGALSQVVILSAALTGSIMTTPTLEHKAIVAGIGALAGAAKLFSDYRATIRSNPAFFLWKSMYK